MCVLFHLFIDYPITLAAIILAPETRVTSTLNGLLSVMRITVKCLTSR